MLKRLTGLKVRAHWMNSHRQHESEHVVRLLELDYTSVSLGNTSHGSFYFQVLQHESACMIVLGARVLCAWRPTRCVAQLSWAYMHA